MKMRKILAVLVAALMLCTIIPMAAVSVSAADAVSSWDFEDGTTGGWTTSSSNALVPTAAADLPVANADGGNYALYFASSYYSYVNKVITVEANTNYKVTFSILSASASNPVNVRVRTNGSVDLAYNSYTPSTTAWETHSMVFNSGSNTSLNFRLQAGWSSTIFYIDNLSVVPFDGTFSDDGHIKNGNFETGDKINWAASNNTAVVADPTGSDHGYVMQTSETASGVTMFSQTASNLKTNTYYKLSFKVYCYTPDDVTYPATSAFWVRFASQITDWSVDVGSSGMTSQAANNYTPRINVNTKKNAWYNVNITFNSATLTETIINFMNYRGTAGYYYFDDIKVREVQDPSFDGYITNGNFETGDLTGWTVTAANIAEENGNYIVQGTNTVKYKNFVHQIVTVEPNTEYAISFKAKAAVSGGIARVYAGTGTGNTGHKNTSYSWSPKTDAWTTYTTSFNSGSDTQIYINLCQGLDNGGDIYYDDVVMWELKDPSYDGYLYNGDFETGVAGNWKLSQSTNINTAAAKDGNFGAQLIGSGWGGLLGYTFAVEAGETYQLTFDAKANTAGFNSSVLVDTWEGEKLATKTVNATEWTTYTLEFTAASNQCYFNLNGYSSSAVVDCYVDNVKVTLVTPACEHAYDNACDVNCNLCGEVREVPAHSYREEIPVNPSCTETGVRVFTCVNCGNMYNESIPALGHTAGAEADCDSAQVCETCGIELNAALGHSYVGEETLAPTCGEAGVMTYTCSACGDSYTEEIAATGEHSYFYPCDIVCQVCFQETNPDAAHNIVAVEAVEATCTANGNIAYWYCSDCGAAWADEALTQMTNQMSVIVPAGHTYVDNCDMDCDVCGEWRDAPHNLTTHVEEVIPANCQEEGCSEYWICADCGGCFQDNGWGGYSEVNPAWLYYTGEHVRPEGAAACAVVACELCGEDSYGSESCVRPEGDPVCQDSACVNCGNLVWGWGCNYNTGDEEVPAPLCQPGTCVYCGTEYEYLYECENGAWAPCQDGECSYGCGKQYPATANHTLEDCTVDGNCSVCWSYIPAGEHTYEYDCSANCSVCANGAREAEHSYFYPCDPVCQICYEETNPDAAHNIVAVEAVEATCTANGNIAYWYCSDCGAAWADEALTQMTNRFNVIVPATGEHTYDDAFDADCNVCGAVRAVAGPFSHLGKSAMEQEDGKGGLAMLFNAQVEGIVVKAGTFVQADYTNATYNGYKLLGLGVKASNGVSEATIEGVRMYELEDGSAKFAFRIINIPADKWDVEITMTPYYIVEIDGVATTLYGEAQVGSYNGVLNG